MKRKELLKYLPDNSCAFLREGRNHSWWHNSTFNKRSAIPRHNEIRNILAIKICKDPGIPRIK